MNTGPFETERPRTIQFNGAATFEPMKLRQVRDETGGLMSAKEAFSRLQWEEYEKDLKQRFPTLATDATMEAIFCSWWSGWSCYRSRDNAENSLAFNAQQATKKSADFDEDGKCFVVLHARQAWFSGHRAAKRAEAVQEVRA